VESALNVAAEQVIEHSAYGALLQRTGNRTRGIAPQGVYACLGDERWLALSVATDAQWGALRAALGEPEWASGAELNTYPGRWAAHDHLDEALAEWCAKQDVQEATDLLVAHGIPAAVVADPRHLVDHPQMRARGFFETISHPVAGKHDAFGLPYRYSGVERWVRSPAPTLGQHNAEVLSSLLGLSDDEIAGLADSGVIGDWPIL
jgi:crotonobetainyl-CoA:carnitine CoA-transferase CaiB-like acyl-CoA transferase